MSAFDPKLVTTQRSNRRGGLTVLNPLLRIEGVTVSYATLSAQFQITERNMRRAVNKARRLKAGLTWKTLKQVVEGLLETGEPQRHAPSRSRGYSIESGASKKNAK